MTPLEQLASVLEGRLSRELLDALRVIQLGIDLRLIERLIVQRQIEEAVRALGWEHLQNMLSEAQRELAGARDAGWRAAIEAMPRAVTVRVKVELSLGAHANANPATLTRIQRQDLTRITNLVRESQEAVREVLQRGIAAGRNPKDIAVELRGIVGMNRAQARALGRFREALEQRAHAAVEAKVAAGQGRVSARDLMAAEMKRIDRAVARRRAEYVAVRAENIARTEVAQAIEDGKRAQWERLMDEGALIPGEWEREWLTARDERTCPLCGPLHGERAPIGGAYGNGSLGPPLHPRCRCDERLVPKGFRRGEAVTPVRDAILRARRLVQ